MQKELRQIWKKLFVLAILICFWTFSFCQFVMYSAEGNLKSPRSVVTSDGNIILVSTKDCYTPLSTTIEGCSYAYDFRKVDPCGEVIWAREFVFERPYSWIRKIFENEDGSFTFIGSARGTYLCGYVSSWLGFSQIEIINIDQNGNLLDSYAFYDECEISYRDVIRYKNAYLLIGKFENIFDDIEETRFVLFNKDGAILMEKEIDPLHVALLTQTEQDQIQIFGIKASEILSTRFDDSLNLIEQKLISDEYYNIRKLEYHEILDHGIYLTFSHEITIDNEPIRRSEILSISEDGTVLNSLEIDSDEVFNIVGLNNKIAVAFSHESEMGDIDPVIYFMENSLEVIDSLIISGPNDERPIELLVLDSTTFQLSGSSNCCNYDTTAGSGKVFLLNGIYCQDEDQDGFVAAFDCDDTNQEINPDQDETAYNGEDDDCNPNTLDDDLDQDGFYLIDDCDDDNFLINPDAEDIPDNGIDEDCNGFDQITTSISSEDIRLLIFPNPTSNILYVSSSGNRKFQLRLLDSKGKVIVDEEESNSIDVTNIPNGLYMLEVHDERSGFDQANKICVIH